MEVKLLANGYKTFDSLYQDFLEGKINEKEEYFSNKTVYIKEAPDFPIYMGRGSEEEKKQEFLQAFKVISQFYINTERDLLLDETFWHSLLLTSKQNFILNKYPEVKNGENVFRNIVLKKFDWENYIYKTILGAQYINDNIFEEDERQRYYELIIENLDLYNYIIKYEIFRNDKFLVNILSIIDELNLSKVTKARIKGREDLGNDERVGRRVIFEFNKSYPVVMSPMLDKEELMRLFLEYLSYYYDTSQLSLQKDSSVEDIRDAEVVTQNAVDDFSYQEKNHVEPRVFSNQSKEVSTAINEESKSLVSRTSVQVKETEKTNKETESEEQDNLLAYLDKHNLKYVDYRSKRGSLWVIGGKRIEEYLKPLEEEGIHFKFKPVGGRASKYRPAWFWYGK